MNQASPGAGNILEKILLPLPNGSGLAGVSILHVSDIHARRADDFPSRALRSLAPVACDLLCVTGDIAENRPALAETARALGRIRPRLGAFACLGNHDLLLGPGQVAKVLAASGVRLLVNESVQVRIGDRRLNLIGTDDPHRARHDIASAYAGSDQGLGALLLTHSPDGVFDVGDYRCDLALSGHTHGGQLNIPMLPTPTNTRNRLPAADGVMVLGGRLCHVSIGLGWSGIPLRLRCRPRAHLLELAEVAG